MSTLLVDIGNTRIKWARFDGRKLGKQKAAEFGGWEAADFGMQLFKDLRFAKRIVISSVAGNEVNKEFVNVTKYAGAPFPEFIYTQPKSAGVTIAYREPWRLGVDRYAMTIAGHWIANGKPVCIASVGTAITIDLVDGKGRHRGGAIVPAPELMMGSLLDKTDGIKKRATEQPATDTRNAAAIKRDRIEGLFARSTRAAIEQGTLFAAAATIDRGVEEARKLLGKVPKLLLTGGGAEAVAPLIRSKYLSVPDLVLQGVAILAVEGKQPPTKS